MLHVVEPGSFRAWAETFFLKLVQKMDVSLSQRAVANKDDPVLRSFFDARNMDFLQRKLVQHVHQETGGRVALSRQSDTELHTLMVAMAQRHSDERLSIEQLNREVLQSGVKTIISNVSSYNQYIRDVTDPRPDTAFDVLRSQSSRPSRELAGRNVW